MTPVLLRCFWPIVILVSGYAYGSGVKTVDLSLAGQRSAPVLASADLVGRVHESSHVEYVDDTLEPLYDFLIELRLHKLCKLFREAHLEDILLKGGPVTIFAPTDGSFVFLPGGTLEEIRRNPQLLREFLLNHIAEGYLGTRVIQDEMITSSLAGGTLRFNIYGADQVYTVSGAQILRFELPFQLGWVHVIDHPLYPIPERTIIGYLTSAHDKFYRLLLETDSEILSGQTYTVFVPDDKAFDYLSQDFLDILNSNRTLAERIVLNHALHGSVFTRGITNGMQLESIGGAPLTFTQSRGLTFVNGVPIVSPDIPVTNGVVHVINRVLLPEDIDTDCHCKSSRSGSVSNVPRTSTRTATDEAQRRGGSRQPQSPGTELTRRPVGHTGQPGTLDSPYGTGSPQTPGTSISTGSDRRPGTPYRTQGPGRPSAGGAGSTPSRPFTGSQFQEPGSPHRGSERPGIPHGVGQSPEDQIHPQDHETQLPSDNFVPGQPQGPGSTFGSGQAQRPEIPDRTGQPQTPGSFGGRQPQTPGSPFGGRQPQTPGSSFGTGHPQTPGDPSRTGSPQRPGSSFGGGQQETPDGTLGTDSGRRPGSPLEAGQPESPDSTFGTRPVQRPDGAFGTDQQQTTGGTFGTETDHRPGSSFGTGQPQTPGTTFGTGRPQAPGTTFGTGHPQAPGTTFGIGTPQRPGSSFGTGQPHTPSGTLGTGSQQRPSSSFGISQSQVPGSTFGTGQVQRQGSHVTKGQTQRRGQGQRPQDASSPRYPQSPGSRIRDQQRPESEIQEPQRPETEDTQRPGSGIKEPQLPGSGLPQRPGSPVGTGQPGRPDGVAGQPERPGSPTGTGQPGRPSGVVGQPQRPENVFEPEYPEDESGEQQIPGSTFETGRPERVGSLSPEEKPDVPGRTKINQPGRIPLPPPPTRAPTPSRTRTTRYPGSQQRGTPAPVFPQDGRTQSGGPPGDNVRGPYRPTRAPSTSVSHDSRYPQPGRTDSRKQPSTQGPQTQPSRHRTSQPVSETTRGPLPSVDRTPTGQIRPIPTRAPISRPGSRPVDETTNCRQPGDRITSSNRNFPLCSTRDVSQEPCQSLDKPINPSDPRPPCPDTDGGPQGCRGALEPPGLNDRRPVCRITQRRPTCRKYNEPRDGRPLCPGSSRNCRLPEEPENPSNPLPICQDIVSVEGCRRPDEPYDPQDRRPECPPDDCRPPQEPLRPGDTRPLCTVNEEDSIRQPLGPTTAKPRYPQQPRPGSHPAGTPIIDQSKPGKQPSQGTAPVGSRPQTPSWQQPHSEPQSPRQPTGTQSLTTQKPGKQPQITPINPSEISPDDNDALISPEVYPPGGSGYPVSSQDNRRQGQPTPVVKEPLRPQPVDPTQPEVQDQDQPGRPHSAVERPSSGQPGIPQTTPQRPGSQSGYPHSTGQRPSGQPGIPQTTPQRPGSQSGYPHSTGQRPSGQPGIPQTTPQRPGSQSGYPHSTGQRPSGQPGIPQTTPQRPGSQSGYPHSTGQRPSGQPGIPQTTPQRPGSQSGYPHSTGQRPSGQPGIPQTTPQRPGSQSGYPHSTGQRPSSPTGGAYPGGRPEVVPQHPSAGSHPSTSPGSSTGGDDSARSLLNIVRDPGLQIKGHPVKLTIVLDLFEKAGLVHILEGPGPATAFLPSDDAFKKLPRGVVEQLREDPELLQQVLLYHVVAKEVRPSQQETSITVPTLHGMPLVITMLKEGRLILIGGAKAVAVTRASNGIFYVINELLYPLPHEDIVSALKSRPDLTQVTSLVQRSGLTHMLTGTKPFTLFAPTDAAFRDLPESTLRAIIQNSTAIQELLLGHIVEGAHFGREFLSGGVFPNARGGKLRFKVLSYGYTVNDVNIKTPEIVTGTGVIHLIDHVLLEPEDFPSLEEQPQGGVNVVGVGVSDHYENYPEIAELARGMGLNKFLSWITNTGLIERVHDGGSYTILAPTDAAVNTLPGNMVQAIDSDPDQVRPLLKFHIITQHIDLNNIRNEQTVGTLLPDKRIRFNVVQDGPEQFITACGVPITQPQGSGSVRLVPVNQPLYPPTGSLAQVLEASPILQNLAKEIRTFHLTWMFTGQGPTTIFAPSDAAFAALSDEDRKNLIENRQAFTELLKRHIVKKSLFSSGIQDGMQVRNENRETLTFSVHPGGISVNSIPISYSDVTATNGVLHVIDHFL